MQFSSYQGGVHICKLAYGDLTWENSSNPESLALWYTMIIGLYINFRGSMEYSMWAISGPWANLAQYMDRTLNISVKL